MAIFKSGIFIIQSEDIITYGAFFFMKFNDAKKKIEFLKEYERKINNITEFSNGYFVYDGYIHRPQCDEDRYFIYDIKNNEERFLTVYSIEITNYFKPTFNFFTNGFVYTSYDLSHSFLNIVKGKEVNKYNIDFIKGYIEQIIYDDNYIYLVEKQNDEKFDNRVYIFDVKKKKILS